MLCIYLSSSPFIYVSVYHEVCLSIISSSHLSLHYPFCLASIYLFIHVYLSFNQCNYLFTYLFTILFMLSFVHRYPLIHSSIDQFSSLPSLLHNSNPSINSSILQQYRPLLQFPQHPSVPTHPIQSIHPS